MARTSWLDADNHPIAAMKAVESTLDDAQHAQVTKLLAELAAYTVMELLHTMTQAKVEQAVK